jgi:hypothetical protein
MNVRLLRALGPAMVTSVALVTLPRCELLVNLDRGEVDGGVPDGCPICTNLMDGGDRAETPDGDGPDGTKDGTAMEDGSTDAGGDATPSDGDAEGATTDSSVGE